MTATVEAKYVVKMDRPTSDTSDSAFTRRYAGACPKCRFVLPPLDECAATYFEQGFVACSNCAERVDVWKAALETINAMPGLAWGLTAAGAAITNFTFDLEAGKFCSIDLTTHGIPAGATVLAITYGPQGGSVFPIEWHGNTPQRRIIGTTLGLIGYPMDGAGQKSRVVGSVVWVAKQESESWLYLVDALEAAANKRYSQATVFAQSALEIEVMPIVSTALSNHASKKNAEDFVKNSLSYSHALNVLLPFLCGQLKVPQLPDVIRGALNRLRKLRNEIVHQGVRSEAIDPSCAGEGLCASVLGFEYLRFIKPKLLLQPPT